MLSTFKATICKAFKRLDTIKNQNPNLNQQTWFEIQPCSTINMFGKQVVITQPSSSFLVYLLGVLTTSVGIYYLAIEDGHMSRILWGWSLILWGVGALIAGTSYQAFGYQLKCQNRSVCRWTSWWEVIYMMFQQVSMNIMLVAVCYSCTDGNLLAASIIYAITCSIIYIVLTFIGGFKPIKSWITFERMVLFCAPIMFFFMGLNGWRYFTLGTTVDLALLGSWALIWLTMILFWIYDYLGWTNKLWKAKRIWFSENDVLHVVLIIWAIYLIPMAEYIGDL